MNSIYLLLGSNMGNSHEQIKNAIHFIEHRIGKIESFSGLYKTAAWGNTEQPDFLNQVIIVSTILNAFQTLKVILAIEKDMGRMRTVKNAPRIIDLDILFFNDEVILAKQLTIPHPEIQNRRFVLIPLDELSPNFMHPLLHQSVHDLLLCSKDILDVKKVLPA